MPPHPWDWMTEDQKKHESARMRFRQVQAYQRHRATRLRILAAVVLVLFGLTVGAGLLVAGWFSVYVSGDLH